MACYGSLASAAKTVGLSSSAVSQQISILEREARVPLLDRGPRGAELTGAGEVLVERAHAVLQLLEETRAAMDQLSGELAGRVRTSAITSAGRPTTTNRPIVRAVLDELHRKPQRRETDR